MSEEKRGYEYEVTAAERGDYTEPGGRSEIIYKGPSITDMEEAAHAAADAGKVVEISVRRRVVRR